MENKALKKILVIAIVFMITFSNCGFTLQALATSEGISVLGFNLFGSNKLEFDAYFLDADGKEQKANVADVNSEMTLVVELEPKEEGYLKSGTIKAIAEEGEPNFEIVEVLTEEQEEEENGLTQVFAPDATLLKTEQVLNVVESPNVETTDEEQEEDNTTNANDVSNTADNTIVEESNTVNENTVSDDAANENVVAQNTVSNTSVSDNTTNTANTTTEDTNTVIEEEEELVDEDAVANEKIEEEKEEVEVIKNAAEASVVSGNEISVENVIESTKLYVKLRFKQDEKLDVSDVYKNINLEFTGKYINVDLEEIDVAADADLEIGWSYSKDIEVTSEYTKVSPFEVGETKGTLVENKIVVKREIEDEKYLPLKQTKIEIEVPELNGTKPIAMEVSANKLMATKGEDINEVVFTNENWEYNEMSNTLIITVENTDANYTYGEDIYVVTYRYENYVEGNEIGLKTSGKVTVEEFSGKDNNVIEKDLSGEQKIVVNVGELITYSIGTTEEKISKGKINANYNSVEAVYETEFSTTVNINVLTNDVLNEFTLKDTKEFYIDKQNLEFETQDVKYKKIKFKYEEIAELLEKGGTIEIKSNSGELLYTLNSELIKSQENCEIEIRGEVTGVEISFKNISVNGTITVDFVKAIGKSSFDKSAFNNFEKLESRIKAEVKYLSAETATELTAIKTEKYFENSFTRAEVTLDRDSLSTIEKNENVEIKIELNNHLETSDLYVNPVFEIAFPKYVKNVEPKATNLLYEDELKVARTVVFTEDGIVKMQVALEGAQTKFSTGNLTNGTNVIINTNIEVDDYTPRKDDQIRMYYYNEGVTNYESQTKWTVKTDIPTGIIKTTNGFDVDVFSYQAPSGFIAVNEIENYDGANSNVASIKQGEETREVEREKDSQVATMKLVAMNNTGNDCTDVTLLGRIPTKDTTDVKTGESLGNNIDTLMVSSIVPDDNNPISSTIYYSANPKATKDLKDGSNGWTETPADLTQMKSFLIVPTGTVAKETIFKYTYQFQIPADLPYEAAMYGSFGAFYNNHSEVAVMYETAVADKVGLVTKAGPKVEAIMTVDIGDGADVLEERMIKYTITVKNTGSVDLTDVTIENKIPKYTKKCIPANSLDTGDNGYTTGNASVETWNIPTLSVGEIIEKTILVRTTSLPDTFEEYCVENGYIESDENGVYRYTSDDQKEYITEMPEKIYIENKAVIKIGNLANEIETNTVKNQLKHANFNIETRTYKQKEILSTEDTYSYVVLVQNITSNTLSNVIIESTLPKEVKFIDLENAGDCTYEFNEETNTIRIKKDSLETNGSIRVYINCQINNMKNIASTTIYNQIYVYAANNIKEHGTKVEDKVIGAKLSVTQDTSIEEILEYEKFNIILNVNNEGEKASNDITFKTVIPEELEVISTTQEGNRQIDTEIVNNIVTGTTSEIDPGTNSALVIQVRPKLLKDNESEKILTINSEVIDSYIGELIVEPSEIKVLKNPEKPITDEEKAEEEEKNTIVDPEANDDYLNDQQDFENMDNSGSSSTENNNINENSNNNNTNIEENNNSENSQNDTNNSEKEPVVEEANIKIAGQVWLDANKNGAKEENEKFISKVKVSLQKDGNTIKACTTDSLGKYRFEELPKGKYSILFEYDSEKYISTTYKKAEVEENINSDAIDLEEGIAVTNNFEIDNGELVLDFGLQERDTFDFVAYKYITKALVTRKNKTTEHKFDDLDLAKLEIKSKELKDTSITFEYKIVVENVGNVSGHAEAVIDYMPSDLQFIESKNKDWILNEDGTLYNQSLKDEELKPGEKRELILYLDKVMTEDNTGVISNKVAILGLNSNNVLSENKVGNEATQEIIVTVSTGRTNQVIFIISLALISMLVMHFRNRKIIFGKTKLSISLKKVYK